MILNIQTPYGKQYKVSRDGYINGSSTWLLLGIRHAPDVGQHKMARDSLLLVDGGIT